MTESRVTIVSSALAAAHLAAAGWTHVQHDYRGWIMAAPAA